MKTLEEILSVLAAFHKIEAEFNAAVEADDDSLADSLMQGYGDAIGDCRALAPAWFRDADLYGTDLPGDPSRDCPEDVGEIAICLAIGSL